VIVIEFRGEGGGKSFLGEGLDHNDDGSSRRRGMNFVADSQRLGGFGILTAYLNVSSGTGLLR
jgi:hypothetical protein